MLNAVDSIYRVESILGKGRGIIANRSIDRGTVILSEAPFILQTLGLTQSTIKDSLSRKSVEDQRRYLELKNCHRGTLPPLLGIFRTNALPCGSHDSFTGQTADTAGIFLQGSLFNSSCLPNVNNCWDPTNRVIVFRALRDIAEGEELSICYKNLFDARDARRSELRTNFRFDCQCAACSLSGEALQLSDQRRMTLKGLYHEIPSYANQPSVGVTKVRKIDSNFGAIMFTHAGCCRSNWRFNSCSRKAFSLTGTASRMTHISFVSRFPTSVTRKRGL